jgi:dienelactone hydrolase
MRQKRTDRTDMERNENADLVSSIQYCGSDNMLKRSAWRVVLVWLAACICALPAQAEVATVDATLTGRAVRIDVYRPDAVPRGAFVLAHGFMRSRATMADHAVALAREGVLAIAPDLPYLTDSRDNARALVELIAQIRAGAFAPAVDRVVLVGFSAGGLATLLAAVSPGVVGYIGLDPFDRPGGEGLAAAQTLRVPALLLRGPPTFCNAYGISAPWGPVLSALVEERLIEGASHCDFEAPTDRWCTFFCGATDAARQQVVRDTLLNGAQRFLPVPVSAK